MDRIKKRVRVRRSDALRSIVTETLPTETPIIFSNDGFYLRAIKNASTSVGLAEELFSKLVKQSGDDIWSEPYSYKIKKNHLSYRSLSVLHPVSQWRMAEFYELNYSLIVHYTTRSSCTLRAPKGVAASYYINSGVSDLSNFKRSHVALAGLDQHLARSPSYFAYQGYGRLYKFFDSSEFIELERKFQNLWMLDVSKCFDSIYTHTILWAVKDKAFAKESFSFKSFGASFDKLMQCANFGETSGIVIGPEISRIFAEIILQQIDLQITERLRASAIFSSSDYEIRRYVDDYFVFAHDVEKCAAIYAAIEAVLADFKLGINEAKIQRYSRPFLTKKSKTILDASKLLTRFTRKFTRIQGSADASVSEALVPVDIYKVDRLFLSFCNDVKMCCANNLGGYDEVSGYLISSLKNRAAKLMSVKSSEDSLDWSRRMYDALILIVRSMIFLYGVAPSVAASYRLATALIMIFRYGEKHLRSYQESLKVAIFSQVSEIIDQSISDGLVDGFVDLESQNLMLAVSEFDDDFRLSPKLLEHMFIGPRRPVSYFNLVTAMFYIKDLTGYAVLRKWIYDSVDLILKDLKDVNRSTEKALVALDFVSCPYIEISRREVWAKLLLDALGIATSDAAAISVLLKDFESMPWFIDWKEIDLLNLLERKELRMVY